jgi:subtilisin family serine protease
MRVLVELRKPQLDLIDVEVAPDEVLIERALSREPDGMFVPDLEFSPISLSPSVRLIREELERNEFVRDVLLREELDFALDDATEHDLRRVARRRFASRTFVRGEIPDDNADEIAIALAETDETIAAVYADVEIEPSAICRDSAAVGKVADVAAELEVDFLQQQGFTGEGVCVALVDLGLNARWLRQNRPDNPLDAMRSVSLPKMRAPFDTEVGHGSMCAFQVGIAAPKAVILDVPVLGSASNLPTLTSDVAKAYEQLVLQIEGGLMPNGLVVNNSWQVYDPTKDFAPGHRSNYSDSINHPLSNAIENLVDAGADVLFAAGNCGEACPYPGCRFQPGSSTIVGANSHPDVVTVGGVDLNGSMLGYSAVGGRLERLKPDVLAFTHFEGSGIADRDGGTSTASPVAAGVIAAIRSKKPPSQLDPRTLRNAVRTSAAGAEISGVWLPGSWNTRGLVGLL